MNSAERSPVELVKRALETSPPPNSVLVPKYFGQGLISACKDVVDLCDDFTSCEDAFGR
jgi:hypothetical protein